MFPSFYLMELLLVKTSLVPFSTFYFQRYLAVLVLSCICLLLLSPLVNMKPSSVSCIFILLTKILLSAVLFPRTASRRICMLSWIIIIIIMGQSDFRQQVKPFTMSRGCDLFSHKSCDCIEQVSSHHPYRPPHITGTILHKLIFYYITS